MNRLTNMKSLFFIVLFFLTFPVLAQNIESSTRKFIDDADISQINKDWSISAFFQSGIGETVQFFPVEIINLKTDEKIKAIQVNMTIKNPDVSKTAWVGLDEIDEFIVFIETYVIPNLDEKLTMLTSSEYIFKAKEMTLSYRIQQRKTRISIWLNDYEDSDIPNYYFWTESKTKKIPSLLEVLKKIK